MATADEDEPNQLRKAGLDPQLDPEDVDYEKVSNVLRHQEEWGLGVTLTSSISR
jgi:hypothetical protein